MSMIELVQEHETDVQKIEAFRKNVPAIQELAMAGETADRASKMRAWMRIMHAAADARIAAVRLECTALRRVGQLLGATNMSTAAGISGAALRNGKAFAAIDDDAFERLLDKLVAASAPNSLYSVVKDEFEAEERERRRQDGYTGFVSEVVDQTTIENQREAARTMRWAARQMIDSLSLEGKPFQVADAATRLGEMLSDNPYTSADADWRSDDVQSALSEVVRDAIRSGDRNMRTWNGHAIPEIITYHDTEMGWVRVPAEAANLSHLLAMVELRRKQAEEMAATAAALAALADDLWAAAIDAGGAGAKIVALVSRPVKKAGA